MTTSIRAVALKFNQSDALAFWTATKTADKAGALFGAIAPALSQYVINGGTAKALRTGAHAQPLVTHIHTGKTLKDKAARAVFAYALANMSGNPGAMQAEHDSLIEELRLQFFAELAALAPARKAKLVAFAPARKAKPAGTAGTPAADSTDSTRPTAFDIAALCALIRSGNLSDSDAQAIAQAMDDTYNTAAA